MNDYLPGTDQPVPAILTGPEAVRYLRLDIVVKDDGTERRRDIVDSLKSLDHLVRKRRVRPIRIGKNRRFARTELDRFIHQSAAQEASE